MYLEGSDVAFRCYCAIFLEYTAGIGVYDNRSLIQELDLPRYQVGATTTAARLFLTVMRERWLAQGEKM
jgi:hypothetical protein